MRRLLCLGKSLQEVILGVGVVPVLNTVSLTEVEERGAESKVLGQVRLEHLRQ
jgi:hypothetical protein